MDKKTQTSSKDSKILKKYLVILDILQIFDK